jgi:hypothetical protein
MMLTSAEAHVQHLAAHNEELKQRLADGNPELLRYASRSVGLADDQERNTAVSTLNAANVSVLLAWLMQERIASLLQERQVLKDNIDAYEVSYLDLPC